MNLIFFGTPSFASHLLRELIASRHTVLAVVTRPDRPRKRSKTPVPSEVKAFCLEHAPSIPLFTPEKASTPSFIEMLSHYRADFFVVAAYGEILSLPLLKTPKYFSLNVHASLLPKYRGAAPIQRALMAGEKETGITLIEMVEKMDAGGMLAKASIPIPSDMLFGELLTHLENLGAKTLIQFLDHFDKASCVKQMQNEAEVTFAPKITSEDRIINWSDDATTIHNQVRALSPKPGAIAFFEDKGEKKQLVIKQSTVVNLDEQVGKPGQTLCYEQGKWIVACGNQALSIISLQVEGREPLAIDSFMRGITKAPTLMLA